MSRLQQQIAAVQARQQRQWTWQCVTTGLLVSGSLACLAGAARLLSEGAFGWQWIAAVGMSGPVIGVAYAYMTSRSMRDAATAIDRSCNLKERTETALQFQQSASSLDPSPLQRLQLADAESHAERVNPEIVIPPQRLRAWPIAVSLVAAALVLMFWSGPRAATTASEVRNDVVQRQASRVEEALDELKAVQKERNDPDLDNLVKELEVVIEQMKAAGMDPKEALAKLSEMEASLQEMQQKLEDPQAAAELQQVGQALALSEAMAMAGQALSKGELEKAADELQKLEMPELDRKTEKAITEQLDKLNQNNGEGSAKKSVQEAASQISDALSKGNRGKFSDGMKGLAGEARKQGQRKKLSNLLRKQCQCLSECKSECESECRSESVLESESIPLGHRQTIRKYVEMIRPGGNETDAVNKRIENAE